MGYGPLAIFRNPEDELKLDAALNVGEQARAPWRQEQQKAWDVFKGQARGGEAFYAAARDTPRWSGYTNLSQLLGQVSPGSMNSSLARQFAGTATDRAAGRAVTDAEIAEGQGQLLDKLLGRRGAALEAARQTDVELEERANKAEDDARTIEWIRQKAAAARTLDEKLYWTKMFGTAIKAITQVALAGAGGTEGVAGWLKGLLGGGAADKVDAGLSDLALGGGAAVAGGGAAAATAGGGGAAAGGGSALLSAAPLLFLA